MDELLRTTSVHIAAPDERSAKQNEIVAVGWSGAVAPASPRFQETVGTLTVQRFARHGKSSCKTSAPTLAIAAFGSTGAEAILPVVSSSSGEVIGTIDAESDRTNAFTPDDDVFLSACARALLPSMARAIAPALIACGPTSR